MTRLLHHPHPDEAALLGPVAKRATNAPAPVERPRGVDARRLPCAPGTSRAVVDELYADVARESLERAAQTAWNRLRATLLQPLPEMPEDFFDWRYWLGNQEAREINTHLEWRARSVAELDGWYNTTCQRAWAATAEVIFPARELCEQLVADVAGNIGDLVALSEVMV